MEQAFRYGSVIQPSASIWNTVCSQTGVMELLKTMGLGGSAWTVNDPEIIRSLMEKGIAANITTRALRRQWQCGRRWKDEAHVSPRPFTIP